MGDLGHYYDWILESFRPYLEGHGIEFGAGRGTVSQRLLPHLHRLDLVEPSANLVAELRRRFAGDDRVRIVPDTFESASESIPDGSRDTAVSVNVLEHMEDDSKVLGEIARILRPGGHLLLFVPALRFLFSELDRTIGHFRRYHLKELRQLVLNAGLDVVAARYFDLLGVIPWWLINTIGRRTTFSPRLADIYDGLGVPFTRAIERLVAPPFGKNIILIARRPGDPNRSPCVE